MQFVRTRARNNDTLRLQPKQMHVRDVQTLGVRTCLLVKLVVHPARALVQLRGHKDRHDMLCDGPSHVVETEQILTA